MLVLTRRKEQTIIIQDNIEITVIDIQGDCVKIGIKAPKNVSVHRKEVYNEIIEENRKAIAENKPNADEIASILKKNIK